MIEYITAGLACTTGIAGALAYIYKKGKGDGIDSACEIRIKDEIKTIKKNADDHAADDVAVHNSIFKKVDKIDGKVDKITGTLSVIEKIVTKSSK